MVQDRRRALSTTRRRALIDFPTVIAAIKDVGFPVVVTAYLLFRLERTLGQLRESLAGLRNTLALTLQPWNGIERRRPPGTPGTRPPWQHQAP